MPLVTIINGGTQGLGEAVARKLVEQGSTGLVLLGRSAERGAALAAELTAAGTETVFVCADTSDEGAPDAVIAACRERFGTVNGLVNVAAKTTRSNVFTETRDHYRKMMAVNVEAPYFLIQATAKLMIETGAKGSIVNIGSTTGHGGQPRLSSYAVSKGALAVMTKNMAYALMRHNIRVNQVNPGWMDTESEHYIQMTEDGAPENWLSIAEASRPMGRLVKPWEVANLIAFCLGDESGMLTGNVIDFDQSVHGAGNPSIPSVEETPTP